MRPLRSGGELQQPPTPALTLSHHQQWKNPCISVLEGLQLCQVSQEDYFCAGTAVGVGTEGRWPELLGEALGFGASPGSGRAPPDGLGYGSVAAWDTARWPKLRNALVCEGEMAESSADAAAGDAPGEAATSVRFVKQLRRDGVKALQVQTFVSNEVSTSKLIIQVVLAGER